MENININNMIKNILSKSNSILDCLPVHLQENIKEVIVYVSNFSLEQGFNYENINDNFVYHGKLSKENLSMCLNSISNDLGICNLLFPGNVYLEDAAHNIGIIIYFMNNNDYEFNSCYNCKKIRIK